MRKSTRGPTPKTRRPVAKNIANAATQAAIFYIRHTELMAESYFIEDGVGTHRVLHAPSGVPMGEFPTRIAAQRSIARWVKVATNPQAAAFYAPRERRALEKQFSRSFRHRFEREPIILTAYLWLMHRTSDLARAPICIARWDSVNLHFALHETANPRFRAQLKEALQTVLPCVPGVEVQFHRDGIKLIRTRPFDA